MIRLRYDAQGFGRLFDKLTGGMRLFSGVVSVFLWVPLGIMKCLTAGLEWIRSQLGMK